LALGAKEVDAASIDLRTGSSTNAAGPGAQFAAEGADRFLRLRDPSHQVRTMIWPRFSLGFRRWSASTAVLGVLAGGGCVMAGVYTAPGGERNRTPESPPAPRASNTVAAPGRADGAISPTGCAPAALQLIELVNAYRAENGLRAIPASPSLCTVAAAHTRDLAEAAPHAQAGCNLHSWSGRGDWTPCCYTPDHAEAACMWNKPRELTEYQGYGYENAAQGTATPAEALQSWRSSAPHDAVILNRGAWASRSWRAIGADVHGGYALLWFGEEADPAQ
jgi:hypothetical protein